MYLILTRVRSWMVWPALFLACVSAYSLQAKDLTPPAGISPERVADFVHAVLDADRTIYTNQVVNRMQAKGIVSAVEHWEHENALPCPRSSFNTRASWSRNPDAAFATASSASGRFINATPRRRNWSAGRWKVLQRRRIGPSPALSPAAANNFSKRSIRIARRQHPASNATIVIP